MYSIAWQPGIGDPSLMGWVTVWAYFLAALLSCLVYWRAPALFLASTIKKQRMFWLLLTIGLLFLGINKQLDLQSLLTAMGKYLAVRDGWYQHRHIVQGLFITGIVLSSLSLLVFLVWYLRETLSMNAMAIAGICTLMGFIAIRASSFHHVDLLINASVFNLRINWIIELSGIILITLSALLILLNRKNSK